MSFWCSVCLYVPVERLGDALRATAAFAVIERKGKVEVALPTGETLSLPRMYDKKRTPAALACRGSNQSFADCATFWFPVDDVILEEEQDYFEQEGLELPIEVRDGVECFPVANVTFQVTVGCRFAELCFTGDNNSVNRELWDSEEIHARFLALLDEAGGVAGMFYTTDQKGTICTLADDEEVPFEWERYDGKEADAGEWVDERTEAVCRALEKSLRPPTVKAAWLKHNGGAVRHLAEAIAADGDLTQLPVLADALEDA